MSDPFEHIDQYISNLLSPADRSAFELALQKDNNLRFAVENYQLSKNVAIGFLEEEVKKILEEEEGLKKNISKFKLNIWWIVGMILFFILLIWVGNVLYHSYSLHKRIEYAMQDYTAPQVMYTRSGELDSQDTLEIAKDAFSKNDFTTCKNLLLKVNFETSQQADVKFYLLSHIFFMEGAFEKSLSNLRKIQNTQLYQEDIELLTNKIRYIHPQWFKSK